MAKTARIVTFGDPHVPYHDPAALDWLCGMIEAFKPTHLVCVGDLMDQAPGSVHATEVDYTIEDEFIAANEYMETVSSCAPDAAKHWTLGNHDSYYREIDPRRIPKHFRSLLNWNKYYPSLREWRQVEYNNHPDSCVEIGQVVFRHGHRTGSTQWQEDLQFCHWTGGHSHRLFVTGHTHRPRKPELGQIRKDGPRLPLWSVNTGTLADWDKLQYARKLDTSAWGQSCLLIEAKMGRACRPTKEWDAELKIRRMFGESA